jgi:uncharacterized lipoprotein YmbA
MPATPAKRLLSGVPRLLQVGALLVATTLAGCGTPAPPPQLYQLRNALPPGALAAPPAQALRTSSAVLLLPVSLPELLDRDAIIVSRGQAGVQALTGERWAEPLREAVPRVLRHDLISLLGEGQVWVAPVPAGTAVQRQLRVELLGLQADAARSQVQLQARWTLSDPTGRTVPRTQHEQIAVPVAGADIDALVVAHRLALWQLAQRLAQRLVE